MFTADRAWVQHLRNETWDSFLTRLWRKVTPSSTLRRKLRSLITRLSTSAISIKAQRSTRLSPGLKRMPDCPFKDGRHAWFRMGSHAPSSELQSRIWTSTYHSEPHHSKTLSLDSTRRR
jgi:hypothetical protein